MTNTILRTDSYKLTHAAQYPEKTQAVYSYLEAREGAEFDYTVFFGLQSILKTIEGRVVTAAMVAQASELARVHFGRDLFNRRGWEYIARECGGKLPVRIRAVPEGMKIPPGNVLMTVENTDSEAYWLTNALESLLLHVWYPTNVASLSYYVKRTLKGYLDATADSDAGLPFMLHDFGYRGATGDEAAAIGGAGHLVNFQGTDTLLAMVLAIDDYAAKLETLAFSVPATEHSVMTALGRAGEYEQVARMLEINPTGIVSVVGDSYDIYAFAETMGTLFHGRIMGRDGKFVLRPDSTTKDDPTPASLVIALLDSLWGDFGGYVNTKGYRVLDPHVGLLWGDGIGPEGIKLILGMMQAAGYSAENIVFGMGGGLLQKHNRDTQKFAFKASAIDIDGKWHDVWKDPLDSTKRSKRGRLKLVGDDRTSKMQTVAENDLAYLTLPDRLHTVFENGELFNQTTFDEIRERAALPVEAVAAVG